MNVNRGSKSKTTTLAAAKQKVSLLLPFARWHTNGQIQSWISLRWKDQLQYCSMTMNEANVDSAHKSISLTETVVSESFIVVPECIIDYSKYQNRLISMAISLN